MNEVHHEQSELGHDVLPITVISFLQTGYLFSEFICCIKDEEPRVWLEKVGDDFHKLGGIKYAYSAWLMMNSS